MVYTKSVPDSIQEFLKVYLQSKKVDVIEMKTAIETMINQSTEIVMSRFKSGDKLSETEINDLVKSSMKKPVCSRVGISLVSDSVKWNVLPMPSADTLVKISVYTHYTLLKKENNIYLQWRSFAECFSIRAPKIISPELLLV